jgi:hypothetical protein
MQSALERERRWEYGRMTDIEAQVRNDITVLDNVEPIAASPRRRRSRVAVGSLVATVVAVSGVIVLARNDGGGSPHQPRVAAPPSQEWSTVTDHAHGLSLSYPRSWQTAPSTLTPVLVDPVTPIAVATYPLDNPQLLGECDIVPQRALEEMGPRDAFIAVYVFQGLATFGSTAGRPEPFGPDLAWNGGALPHRASGAGIQCTENVPGFVGDLSFDDHGKHLSVLIAFGPQASAETRDEVYRILDTVTVTQQ